MSRKFMKKKIPSKINLVGPDIAGGKRKVPKIDRKGRGKFWDDLFNTVSNFGLHNLQGLMQK